MADKIAILRVKERRIWGREKRDKARHELSLLMDVVEGLPEEVWGEMKSEIEQLEAVNGELWCILEEQRTAKGADFMVLSRKVLELNDHRFALKQRINEVLKSGIHEVKHYSTKEM
jgi:hypothetical protein